MGAAEGAEVALRGTHDEASAPPYLFYSFGGWVGREAGLILAAPVVTPTITGGRRMIHWGS